MEPHENQGFGPPPPPLPPPPPYMPAGGDPYLPPVAAGTSDRVPLRIQFGRPMPALCAACGEPAVTHTTLQARQQADSGTQILAFLACGLIGALIAGALTNPPQRICLPLCTQHRHWKLFSVLEGLGWVVAIVGIIAAYFALMDVLPELSLVILLAGLGVVFTALIVRRVAFGRFQVKHVDPMGATITRVSRRFAVAYVDLCRQTPGPEGYLASLEKKPPAW